MLLICCQKKKNLLAGLHILQITSHNGTESNMTINFQDWCGAPSLYYNNHTEITFLLCEQTPYLLWFLCWQRVHVE